jgi:colanic acid/amylovoran biosynthesis glycosyltransferase
LVLPSFSENLPVVIMEAMALGRPVISTYIAGIPELVRPGKTGWLVPASDESALAEAMREALTASVAELERMGAAGRLHVAECHDTVKEATKLKSLFEVSIDARTADKPD